MFRIFGCLLAVTVILLVMVAPANGQRRRENSPRSAFEWWNTAQSHAKEYIDVLNTMNVESGNLYVLLESANEEQTLVANAKDLTLTEIISLTKHALERAKATLQTHQTFKEKVDAASQIHPKLIRALQFVVADTQRHVESMEFNDHKQALYIQASELGELLKGLEENPVTLPDGYIEMGRYIQESIEVLERGCQIDSLRLAFSTANYSKATIQLSLQKYKDAYQQWLDTKLKAWRAERLSAQYRLMKTKEPENFAKQVVDATYSYAVYRPDRESDKETGPSGSDASRAREITRVLIRGQSGLQLLPDSRGSESFWATKLALNLDDTVKRSGLSSSTATWAARLSAPSTWAVIAGIVSLPSALGLICIVRGRRR